MKRHLAMSLMIVTIVLALALPGLAEGRRYVKLPGASEGLPFSDAVLVGDTLYLSGRLGLKPGTRERAEEVEDEARIILDGMKAVLAEVGMTMQDLVSIDVFCSDPSLYGRFNTVYRTYFKEDFPARAFIGSGPLLFGARFEVRGIAVRQ